MAGFEDFLKGASVLNQALQQKAVNNSISNFQSTLKDINDQGLDDLKQRQAILEASQTFALDASKLGIGAQQLQQTLSTVRQPTTPTEFFLAGQEETGRELQEFQTRPQRQALTKQITSQIRTEQRKELKAQTKENRGELGKSQKEFNSLTRDTFKALEKIETGESALRANNPVADASVKTLLAKASGEVGNLTEAERDMFAGSPALAARAKRLLSLQTTGLLPDSDRRDLQELLQIYKSNARRNIERRGRSLAEQLSERTGQSADVLFGKIATKSVLGNLPKIQEPSAIQPAQTQPTQSERTRSVIEKFRIR